MSQAPQAGAPITVWVKRTDVTGARYVAVKGVDVGETVDDFIARWMAQAKLDVDPSLVTLRLVKCGTGKPTAEEEAAAKVLDDPSLTLAETCVGAGATGTPWLLADAVQLALLAVEREEEAERQRAERRARRGAQRYSSSTS